MKEQSKKDVFFYGYLDEGTDILQLANKFSFFFKKYQIDVVDFFSNNETLVKGGVESTKAYEIVSEFKRYGLIMVLKNHEVNHSSTESITIKNYTSQPNDNHMDHSPSPEISYSNDDLFSYAPPSRWQEIQKNFAILIMAACVFVIFIYAPFFSKKGDGINLSIKGSLMLAAAGTMYSFGKKRRIVFNSEKVMFSIKAADYKDWDKISDYEKQHRYGRLMFLDDSVVFNPSSHDRVELIPRNSIVNTAMEVGPSDLFVIKKFILTIQTNNTKSFQFGIFSSGRNKVLESKYFVLS